MAQINLRIDDDVKKEAEMTLNEIGLSMSSAVNIFLKKVAREHRIPFELNVDPFYSKANIEELERRIYNLKTGKTSLVEHDLIED